MMLLLWCRVSQLLRRMSQVVTLVKLVLVMPATNTISERSFSAMTRTTTYLTMLQECLTATMVLHVHKEYTDALNLQCLSNEFVSNFGLS